MARAAGGIVAVLGGCALGVRLDLGLLQIFAPDGRTPERRDENAMGDDFGLGEPDGSGSGRARLLSAAAALRDAARPDPTVAKPRSACRPPSSSI